jgi:hypothetical protein
VKNGRCTPFLTAQKTGWRHTASGVNGAYGSDGLEAAIAIGSSRQCRRVNVAVATSKAPAGNGSCSATAQTNTGPSRSRCPTPAPLLVRAHAAGRAPSDARARTTRAAERSTRTSAPRPRTWSVPSSETPPLIHVVGAPTPGQSPGMTCHWMPRHGTARGGAGVDDGRVSPSRRLAPVGAWSPEAVRWRSV